MKKIICAMLCILLVFSLSACGGNVNEVNTHNVESEIYSEEDIAAAIDTIKKEFKSNWKGCTLTEIYYAGDDSSKDHQDWADRNNADEVIVLLSSFDVDSSGGDGSLNPNSTYNDWKWILVRTNTCLFTKREYNLSDIASSNEKIEEFYKDYGDGNVTSSWDKVTTFYNKQGKKLFKFGLAYDNVQLLVKEVKNTQKSISNQKRKK